MNRSDAPDRRNAPAIMTVVLAGLLAACVLTACNTTRGLGEDIEELGDSIEDAAQ